MTEEDDEDDRRRAERVPINAEFGQLPDATYISNLSESGLFVQTPDRAAMGSIVRLRFTVLLADPFVLEACGRVVRHSEDPVGMGIEFTELSPETMLRINDVVALEQPRELGPPVAGADPFDGQQTVVRGQIPIGPEALTRTHRPSAKDDGEDGATSRFPVVSESASTSGEGFLLGSGEYEVVDDSEDEP